MERKAKSTGSPLAALGEPARRSLREFSSLPHPALRGPGFCPAGLKFLLLCLLCWPSGDQKVGQEGPILPLLLPLWVPLLVRVGGVEGEQALATTDVLAPVTVL